jgi:alpha/beta superfamily hydrolase
MEPVRILTEDHVFLEGELRLPEERIVGSAVICHPHPRHGGSKDHPILWAIRNELAHRGFAVLAFNFRGVMGSGGSYGGGHDELRDLRAAVGVARERVGDDAPTFVCGWSFGASVALREALDDERVGALALIGMPLDPKDVELPAMPASAELRALARRPVLLIAGERDEYCPSDRLRRFGAAFPAAEVTIVGGTDHYFWRRERELGTLVGEFAERRLGAP